MDHDALAVLAEDRIDELRRAARPRRVQDRTRAATRTADRERAGLLQRVLRRPGPRVRPAPC